MLKLTDIYTIFTQNVINIWKKKICIGHWQACCYFGTNTTHLIISQAATVIDKLYFLCMTTLCSSLCNSPGCMFEPGLGKSQEKETSVVCFHNVLAVDIWHWRCCENGIKVRPHLQQGVHHLSLDTNRWQSRNADGSHSMLSKTK